MKSQNVAPAMVVLAGVLALCWANVAFAVEPAGGSPTPEAIAEPPAAAEPAPANPEPPTAAADSPDASVESPRDWLVQPTETGVTKAETSPSPMGYGFAIVLLLGLGGAALYARKRRGGALLALEPQRLRVISSTKIGPRAHVVATEVGGRIMLLGVTEHSVNHLAWLSSSKLDAEYPLLAGDDDEPVVEAELAGPVERTARRDTIDPRRGSDSASAQLSTRDALALRATNPRAERPAGVPRSFREVLGGVLGEVRRNPGVADLHDIEPEDNAAATLLAEQTPERDEFVAAEPAARSIPRDTGRRRRLVDDGPLSEAAYRSSLEEQVAGLVRRRQAARK